MAGQLVWLLASHGLLIGIGASLVDAGYALPGWLLMAGSPAARIARRFLPGKGYYLIGYVGEVGGSPSTPSGGITRRSAPLRFGVLLTLEVAIVVFILLGVLLRA
jgi:hypothetical protein